MRFLALMLTGFGMGFIKDFVFYNFAADAIIRARTPTPPTP